MIEGPNFNGKTKEVGEEAIKETDVKNVPDWRYEPGTPLSEPGEEVKGFSVLHTPEATRIPQEVLELRKHLEGQDSKTFFNGPLVNVEAVEIKDGEITIKTKETSLFDYIASDYYFHDNQGENPIRPLAVQATLFSPGGKRIILERRSKTLTDMPDKLTEFGGALRPGETDLIKATQERLEKKWGLKVPRESIIPTSIVRENVNNIYCANFVVELPEDVYQEAKGKALQAMRKKERMFYEISTDEAINSVEKIFLGKRDITQWEPLGYYNILYALVRRGLRKKEDIRKLLGKAKELSKERPFKYTYPMEKYLK